MFALKFASYAHLILKMSKTSRNLCAFSWGKFSWTEMICVKKLTLCNSAPLLSLKAMLAPRGNRKKGTEIFSWKG